MSRHNSCFLLAFALPLAPLGCKSESLTEKVIRPVRVHKVKAQSADQSRTFSGTTRAGTESNLSFKVGGQISKLLVKVGDKVKTGQPIATLDDKDLRLKLRQVQAAAAQTRAQWRNAQANHRRLRRLYENRSIALKDLDAARAQADSAKAALAAQGQAVALARQQLQYCKLVSPAEGRIAAVPVAVNENVQPGKIVATLNYGARAEVRFNVPGTLIQQVKRGQKIVVKLSALKGKQFSATVREVGIRGGATAFSVTAQLDAKGVQLRSGLAAEVTVRFGKETGAEQKKIRVPAHVVAEDRRGRFVFIVQPDKDGKGRIKRRPIKSGQLSGRGVEVLEGLADGELVVSAGLRFVEPEMMVRILGAAK